MSENTWKTAISDIKPNEVRLRGYRIDELMGRVDFGQAFYLLLRGELPDEGVGRLMTAMLVSSVDHGPGAPSALAARTAASTSAPLNACIASGVLHINRSHGGAIEDCARALADVIERADTDGCSLDEAADKVLADYKDRGIRVAGFGHRVHTNDPRTARLFDLAAGAGVAERHIEAARAVERGLERQIGRKLPINVDGAIGAVLGGLGFEYEIMNGFFILARTAGLIAQAREEMTRERPMRNIDPAKREYDGPAHRSL
ncbi:MAG TPA: citryl-CoA lyase [Phycisphaerae bacterium]|nr:citryl-CoA lyase [Phycisphaerae bacterium]